MDGTNRVVVKPGARVWSAPRPIVSGRVLCYIKGSREVLGRVFPRIKEIGGRER